MLKSPTAAWLFVEQGARAGTSVRLEMKPVVMGRDPDAELQMDPHHDLMASGRHARVSPSVRGWEIRDLGSRNGTWVNGEHLRGQRVLEPGDRVRLGKKGPLVLFTNQPPETLVADRRRAPRTIAASNVELATSSSGPSKGLLLGAGAVVVLLAAALAFWGGRALSGPEIPETPTRSPADPSGDRPSGGTTPGTDTAAARRDAEIDALRRQIDEMSEAFERSEQESERLRGALAEARRTGASDAEVDSLSRALQRSDAARQQAEASLRLQQLAGSLEYEELSARAAPATAQVYAEFEGNEVIAATAFGVDERGLLLTNRHVIRRSGRALLRLGVQYAERANPLPARVAAVSPAFDLAIIELVDPGGRFPVIGDFNERLDTLAVPSPVALFGFPLGGEGGPGSGVARPLVSAGVLIGRSRDTLELEGYGRVGASGSPILDADGRVVGILQGGRTTEGGERLYAVPASRALEFLRAVTGSGG
jgi:S1-C subfamily serine protease